MARDSLQISHDEEQKLLHHDSAVHKNISDSSRWGRQSYLVGTLCVLVCFLGLACVGLVALLLRTYSVPKCGDPTLAIFCMLTLVSASPIEADQQTDCGRHLLQHRRTVMWSMRRGGSIGVGARTSLRSKVGPRTKLTRIGTALLYVSNGTWSLREKKSSTYSYRLRRADKSGVAGIFSSISEEMAAKLPDSTARLPVAGRENEYIVTLDVFHQMHCLVSRIS